MRSCVVFEILELEQSKGTLNVSSSCHVTREACISVSRLETAQLTTGVSVRECGLRILTSYETISSSRFLPSKEEVYVVSNGLLVNAIYTQVGIPAACFFGIHVKLSLCSLRPCSLCPFICT